MMNFWGTHADHVGNCRVIRVVSYFIPFIPVLWIFSHNPVYLVIIQIFAGFFWAGLNLSASNFIYDVARPEKRTRCVAYFNVINGLAIALGALTGGLLLKVVPPLFGYKIISLFVISGIGRMLVALFLANFKEVRQVPHVSNRELLYRMIRLRPIVAPLNRSSE